MSFVIERVVEQLVERDITNEPRAVVRAGDLASLREQVAAARVWVAEGRYAPGVRRLRAAIGGLARREDWVHAGDAAVALASGLLVRGAAREAAEVLDLAEDYATRGGSPGLLLDVAILRGHAWIDLGQLDQAHAALGSALAVAERLEDGGRIVSASLAHARCLFWKGEYAAALSTGEAARGAADAHGLARIAAAAARAAVGARDTGRALAFAREARASIAPLANSAAQARGLCAAAFVHLAVDDIDAAVADLTSAIGAARAARDPLRATRARILLAECERRRGRIGPALALVARVRRLRSSCLPPVVRARLDLLDALLAAPSSSVEDAERLAGRMELPALALYATHVRRDGPSNGARASSTATDGVVEILRACHAAEDEVAVLGDVCARLRRLLHAASAAVFVRAQTATTLLASAGARADYEIAHRVVAADAVWGPQHQDDRVDMGVPICYGGGAIGVLTVRWPAEAFGDAGQSFDILRIVATAVAPMVATSIGPRTQPVEPGVGALVGHAAPIEALRRAVRAAAGAPFPVLVEGESGSGKELVARAVHQSGPRRDRPFCSVNCAALPDDLVESELFGHARGAFTGAVSERAGVFEEAHGGTLFLDEVGELTPRAQAKLLRVCQEGELRRLGENVWRRIDVRLVCATNRDLRQEAADGRFRFDLLYRLDVVRIAVPPLRDRGEDIGLLADHFWREATARIGSRAVLGAATRDALARYSWPGNVRELQNVLASLAVRAPRRGVVGPTSLPPQFGGASSPASQHLGGARRAFEAHFVRAALARSGGRRARAAAELGVTRQGLTKLMARLGLDDGTAVCAL